MCHNVLLNIFVNKKARQDYPYNILRNSLGLNPHPWSTTLTLALAWALRHRVSARVGYNCIRWHSFHTCLSFKMSQQTSWKSEKSTPSVDICKTCATSYPVCQTCSKYGRQRHLVDTEKSYNAHDNSSYCVTENKDPRNKK